MVGNTKGKECEDKDPKWECPPIKNVTHPLVGTLYFAMKMNLLAEIQKKNLKKIVKPIVIM